MNATYLRDMTVLTVTDPAEAARRLMALQPGREVLWLALALVVVLNTFLHAVSNLLVPVQAPELQPLSESLVLYVLVAGGGLVLSILAFYHVGSRMGGTGTFNEIMILMVWLQFMRVLVQAIMVVLLISAPVLSALAALAAFILGIYITVHFLDQAHRFGSPATAVGVLVLSALAIAVVLVVLMTLIGGPMMGTPANV